MLISQICSSRKFDVVNYLMFYIIYEENDLQTKMNAMYDYLLHVGD